MASRGNRPERAAGVLWLAWWSGYALSTLCALPSPARADSTCVGPWSVLRPMPRGCLPPIDTDRPHLTDSPLTVPAGHVQLESGLAMYELGARDERRWLLLENIYKLGVVDGVDLQVLTTHASLQDGQLRWFDPVPLVLRSKLMVMAGDGLRPDLTLVPVVAIPLRAEQSYEAGGLVFLAWDLPFDAALEVNTGVIFEWGDRVGPLLTLGGALTAHLAGPLSVFSELYSVTRASRVKPRLAGTVDEASRFNLTYGGGVLLAVHRDVQLDAGLFAGLSGDAAPLALFVGVSFRI